MTLPCASSLYVPVTFFRSLRSTRSTVPFMPLAPTKKPRDGIPGLENIFSDEVRLFFARFSQAIPRPAGNLVVHVERAHRLILPLVPDRQLPARSIDVVIENNDHARRQIPARRRHLIVQHAHPVVFRLR